MTESDLNLTSVGDYAALYCSAAKMKLVIELCFSIGLLKAQHGFGIMTVIRVTADFARCQVDASVDEIPARDAKGTALVTIGVSCDLESINRKILVLDGCTCCDSL